MNKKLGCVICVLLMILTMASVPAKADGAWGELYMYVETGNSGRLHLRARPDGGSESLGLYRNGTRVLVEGFANGAWAAVLVDGRRGYMNVNYLSGYAPAKSAAVSLPAVTENTTLYVRTGNSGKLHLRAGASQAAESLGLYPNGTAVQVLARSGGWAFVNVHGAMGYMMLNYLSGGTAASYSSRPQATPAPVVMTGAVTVMYVNTGNMGRLNLRAAPCPGAASLGLYANGTQVYASSQVNGWSQVIVGGQTGYMLTSCLSPLPPTSGSSSYCPQPITAPQYAAYYSLPVPAPTASPAPSCYAGAVITVRNRNSSFVYLRSSREADRKDNILSQVPVGAQVTMLESGQYWSRVRYNGTEGYMVSGYLK